MTYQLFVLQTETGHEVLAYTKGEFSKRDVRRLAKKFRNDKDVIKPITSTWERFYDSIEEMKKDVPEV